MTCNEHQPKIMPDWKKVFVSRQEFLKLLGLGLSGFIGMIAVIPGAALFLNYLFVPKRSGWVKVGPVSKFKTGETVDVVFENPYKLPWDGVTGNQSAWLRKISDDQFTAFAINCTHLGCPVRWEPGAELFMCPCHGGVYLRDGEVAAGPPPRPLQQYPVRIADGHVELEIGPLLTEG